MNQTITTLKANGLIFILLGAILVLLPQHVSQFLSDDDSLSKITTLVTGIVFNLNGMLMIWISNRQKPNKNLIRTAAITDFLWALFFSTSLITGQWITTTNGITLAGIAVIILGWTSWSLWQQQKV